MKQPFRDFEGKTTFARHFWNAAVLLSFSCLVIAGGFYIKLSYAKPQIELSKTALNLGTVEGGADIRHLFPIHNKGRLPLIINKVEASCGCIKRRRMLRNNVIMPGKSEPLEIVFSTPMRRKTIRETVTLHTNDPDQPEIAIILVAQVNPSLEFDPPLVNFGIVEEADLPLTKKVRIKAAGEKSADKRKFTVSNDSNFFSSKIEEPRYGPTQLVISLSRSSPLDPIDGTLQMADNRSNHQKYIVRGKIVGETYAEPEEVNLRIPAEQKTITQKIQVKGAGKKIESINIEKISSSLNNIVETSFDKDGESQTLTLLFNLTQDVPIVLNL